MSKKMSENIFYKRLFKPGEDVFISIALESDMPLNNDAENKFYADNTPFEIVAVSSEPFMKKNNVRMRMCFNGDKVSSRTIILEDEQLDALIKVLKMQKRRKKKYEFKKTIWQLKKALAWDIDSIRSSWSSRRRH